MKKHKFLFLATYGRSGGTLLMGILNSISSYRIVGENNNAYTYLCDFYQRMIEAHLSNNHFEGKFEQYNEKNPWWNIHTPETLKQATQQYIATLIDPEDQYTTIGFKEIRYNKPQEQLTSYLNTLYNIFNCRFIFLTRNHNHTCKSDWHKNEPNCKETLIEIERKIQTHMKDHPLQDWFCLHFDDLHNIKPIEFKVLFRWLGERYDKEQIKKVLSVKHGY